MSNHITLLAIESSCDETSAAVLHHGQIVSNVTANQQVHVQYGGVVPELASRAHQQHIVPVVAAALQQAGKTVRDLHAIAFTRGPGLMGSLLVGTSFAKGMALALNIPLIDVQHMHAHVLAHLIEDPKPPFPFLCLTVSGGHTQIVHVHSPTNMQLIGETRDDAVGEAFDKAAKMLGLPYPGGPLIDKYAQQGNPLRFTFPQVSTPGLDFSFSGIKTAFLYFLQTQQQLNPDFIAENLNDICASIQHALITILLTKLRKAARQTGIRHVAIAGGVAANSGLRKAVAEMGQTEGWQVYVPRFEYCTDNAAMIAMAAYYKFLAGDFCGQDVSPLPRMAF
ncbi:MAG: tRNA (adenosine(37)-N6)-threonylcarbamoyltransferase complex transferase subunit TsaD [Cytophagales bacterium]|nr:tRNA (adenosine(37)-N6)-threonylcarbamoyltransferase complex transferase subunit TsaD [Bernardetiaceae bacterium]MDW8205936.1 tRNA (adenosine(37)-N6)-threonylcarbamoyltransferase complex transferase subunit TsaD [Cytophagales bacterium]